MSKILYCTTCSQGFSRKGSGLRHISTLHQGQGKLVSTIDYMIGRIEGKYFPAEPLSYRRNNRRHIQSRPNNLYNNNESSNFSKADPNDHDESILHEELGHNTISHSENSNIGIKTKRNNSGNTSILTDSETDMVSYLTQKL